MRKAFKMKLYDGMEKEYERRHTKIWPEVKQMIKSNGISNYSIYFDKDTNLLFAYMETDAAENVMGLNAVRAKWWKYMSDIMETNEDLSPVSIDLHEVFHID